MFQDDTLYKSTYLCTSVKKISKLFDYNVRFIAPTLLYGGLGQGTTVEMRLKAFTKNNQ